MTKTMISFKEPVWEPLIQAVGNRSKEFMFIGQVPLGELWLFLYKHRITRRYLNLDGKGNAYLYTPDGYIPIDHAEAVDRVFT